MWPILLGKGRRAAAPRGEMTRGLLFAPIIWLLIGSDGNFTGTSNPPKYQLLTVTCSGSLIPRYLCSQVLRDIGHQIHRAQLSQA